MDQLDVWAIRGRVATAIRNTKETLARLAVDNQELTEALTEAEQLGESRSGVESITADTAACPTGDAVYPEEARP